MNNTEKILAPFSKIPTIKPRLAERSDVTNDPAFKIAPLTLYFGATDLGHVQDEQCDTKSLFEELRAARLLPKFRDATFGLV